MERRPFPNINLHAVTGFSSCISPFLCFFFGIPGRRFRIQIGGKRGAKTYHSYLAIARLYQPGIQEEGESMTANRECRISSDGVAPEICWALSLRGSLPLLGRADACTAVVTCFATAHEAGHGGAGSVSGAADQAFFFATSEA